MKYCGSQEGRHCLPSFLIMKNLDTIITVIGIIYGVLLVLAAFIRTKVTEAFRVDALFMSNPSEATRPLNLIAGILVAGYSIYSLLKV